MNKNKPQDAMEYLEKESTLELVRKRGKRDKWLADYYVFEEEAPVCVDFLHKTKFGLWKEIDTTEVTGKRDNDPYVEGRSLTCNRCNTSYNTRLRKPRCPYCHHEP